MPRYNEDSLKNKVITAVEAEDTVTLEVELKQASESGNTVRSNIFYEAP